MKLFQWIWAAIVGFVVGLIARALLPGADQRGLLTTSGVGIRGSGAGGLVSSSEAAEERNQTAGS
jgi:uncharacterized membrane protein YeaQ/YmgE (transglycosylase-associated protein family)